MGKMLICTGVGWVWGAEVTLRGTQGNESGNEGKNRPEEESHLYETQEWARKADQML